MGPFILPAALMLGGFWFLSQDENGKKRASTVQGTATLPSGITAFRPEARNAVLRTLSRKGLAPEPVQGQKAPVFRVVPLEAGAMSATQVITTFEARGFCAVVSANVEGEEAFVVFARPGDVGSFAGPTSTLALLTLAVKPPPAQAGAVGRSPATPDPEIDAAVQAGIDQALADENADPEALREVAKTMTNYPAMAKRIEKRAGDLELKRRLANLSRTAPQAPVVEKPKAVKNGASAQKTVIVETQADVAPPLKADA